MACLLGLSAFLGQNYCEITVSQFFAIKNVKNSLDIANTLYFFFTRAVFSSAYRLGTPTVTGWDTYPNFL